MRRILIRTLLGLIFISQMACSRHIITPNQIKLPEYGSRQMLVGVRDGCDTAHSSRGNSLYRTFFTFEQKPELIVDDEYYDSWYRGYIYCFHIVNRNAYGSIDSYLTPEHSWFWGGGNNGIKWAWDQGVDINLNAKLRFIGEGEAWWAGQGFIGNRCNGIFQC